MVRGSGSFTLQQLHYFIEVAAEGSISAAADLLYVSQPTMSAAMKDLETRIGRPLFTRSARGVVLTVDGVRPVPVVAATSGPSTSCLLLARNAGDPGPDPTVEVRRRRFLRDGGMTEEVQEFARQRPAAFLGGAALAGFAVGRLVRAGRAQSQPAQAGEQRSEGG